MHSQLHSGVELSSNSGHNNHIADGTFRITAQCMGIPEEVQRPLSTDKISAVQLNVGDGSTGTLTASPYSMITSYCRALKTIVHSLHAVVCAGFP